MRTKLKICRCFEKSQSDLTNEQKNICKSEADYFARCLLIPEHMFLKIWRETHDLDAIALHFCVELKVLIQRMRDIFCY